MLYYPVSIFILISINSDDRSASWRLSFTCLFFSADINSTSNLTVVGTGPVLTLSNVDTSVAGTYYCVVLNDAGAGIETVNLYITPKITTHPVGINATNGGSSHTMTCMADSFPDPEYRWERSNHLGDEYSVIPDSEGSSYNTGTISFPTNGYYRCIAYTNVSGIINETASNPAVITGKCVNCLATFDISLFSTVCLFLSFIVIHALFFIFSGTYSRFSSTK